MKRMGPTMFMFALLPMVCVGVSARPGEPPEETPARGGNAGDEAARRDEARSVLARRLETLEKEEATLREAMEMLGRGEPLEAVRDHARLGIGEGLRDRAQGLRERRNRLPQPDSPPPPPPQDEQRPPIEPERAMEVLRQMNPQLHERLGKLRENDPEQFRVLLDRFAPRLAEFDRERRDQPELWNLRAQMLRMDREAATLARRAAEAEPGEQNPSVDALRDVVGRQFDLRLRMREQEVGRLNERVDEIRAQIGKAARDREGVVTRRVRQLIRDAREGRVTPGEDNGLAPDRPGPRREGGPDARERPGRPGGGPAPRRPDQPPRPPR